MELRKLGITGKIVSVEQKILMLFRLIGSTESGDSRFSLPNPVFTFTPHVRAACREAELRKEWVMLYWRRLDPPK